MKQSASRNFLLTGLFVLACSSLTAQNALDGLYVRPETVVQFEIEVREKRTGEKLQNACISIENSSGRAQELYTNENGQGMTFIGKGVYNLLVYKLGFISTRDTLIIEAVPDTIAIQFTLEKE